ncbi:MAG: hypothetical protein KDJ54_18335 [Candidatus Competibacteraceae bacterium]|nr:hypothetical protein [Candidatus Competibacteraceae bacterium]
MSELDQDALDLQRRYAGHLFTQNGFVPNAKDVGAPNVKSLALLGHNNGVVEVAKEVEVREELSMPPVAAFVDTLPMPIRIQINEKPNDQPSTYTVFLKVPAGIRPGQGNVWLRWPIKEISATPQLRLQRSKLPVRQEFDLLEKEGDEGMKVAVGNFDVEPIEVEFGDTVMPEDQWNYDPKDKKLTVLSVPTNIEEVLIKVVTSDGKRYRSKSNFTTYHQFDLLSPEGKVDMNVSIGRFDKQMPVKVCLRGAKEISVAKDEWKFENSILSIEKIPGPHDNAKTNGSRVIVKTDDGKLYISKGFFRRNP